MIELAVSWGYRCGSRRREAGLTNGGLILNGA